MSDRHHETALPEKYTPFTGIQLCNSNTLGINLRYPITERVEKWRNKNPNKHKRCNGYRRINLLMKNLVLVKEGQATFSEYPADITKPLNIMKKDTPHTPPA